MFKKLWKYAGWKEVLLHRKDAWKLAKGLPKGVQWCVGREYTNNYWCLTILVPPSPHVLYDNFLVWCRRNHVELKDLGIH